MRANLSKKGEGPAANTDLQTEVQQQAHSGVVIIVSEFDLDVQMYARQFSEIVFPRPDNCPNCGQLNKLVGHGSYPRHPCDPERTPFLIRVKRFYCLVCHRTTLILPSFYYARYRKGGFEALKPQVRSDADKPRRIPQDVVQKAIALREELPSRSARTIVEILHRDPDVPTDLKLVPHTLSLILNKRGKSRESLAGQAKAFKRFEREHANSLWQGDMLVGPYLPDVERSGKYRRTALFCFIDDYSRLVPFGEFFFEESLPRLERVLKVAILRRGIPGSLYVDNGRVYVSTQLSAVCATLGIRAIHSTPYTPNTRGKIERFFGTVRSQFLNEVEAAKIATLEELNSSFQAWVEIVYHRRIHSETDCTPLERFQQSIAKTPVRQADPVQLRQAFLCARETQSHPDSNFIAAGQPLRGRSTSGWASGGITLRPFRSGGGGNLGEWLLPGEWSGAKAGAR